MLRFVVLDGLAKPGRLEDRILRCCRRLRRGRQTVTTVNVINGPNLGRLGNANPTYTAPPLTTSSAR
ncbi:hypothetical protein I553_3646 [Mycobacterium xenopi 4042]|uniref:Uncharacterized protein n=1 Tax=Mycobacterium xenopi 4042 TaxID=1299334 RepID=X7ZZM9_MYCXE|nr:hypothetical protein I553_3646 [Mycobacterium xenopi 4042]